MITLYNYQRTQYVNKNRTVDEHRVILTIIVPVVVMHVTFPGSAKSESVIYSRSYRAPQVVEEISVLEGAL